MCHPAILRPIKKAQGFRITLEPFVVLSTEDFLLSVASNCKCQTNVREIICNECCCSVPLPPISKAKNYEKGKEENKCEQRRRQSLAVGLRLAALCDDCRSGSFNCCRLRADATRSRCAQPSGRPFCPDTRSWSLRCAAHTLSTHPLLCGLCHDAISDNVRPSQP